jgi:hypothetical protein
VWVVGQFQNSVQGRGSVGEQTKRREDHQDYSKHEGPQKDPLEGGHLLHGHLPLAI